VQVVRVHRKRPIQLGQPTPHLADTCQGDPEVDPRLEVVGLSLERTLIDRNGLHEATRLDIDMGRIQISGPRVSRPGRIGRHRHPGHGGTRASRHHHAPHPRAPRR
jgi:hypothetical protein